MTYIIALISILLGSFAQYFLKIGMKDINLGNNISTIAKDLITSYPILGGVFCYGLSLVFWLIVLSRMELSKAYPMVSLGYVFTLVIGYIFLNEGINFYKISGIILIILGVFAITRA